MRIHSESADHYGKIRKVLLIVLVLNWAVAAAKMLYGFYTRCSSMTADGFHSLADGTSNIIGIIGLAFCSQPKDEDHPYGHKKYETLFALAIAGLLFLVMYQLIEEGLRRFAHPVVPKVDGQSFVVMLLTIGVNVAVMLYEYRKGKQLKSDILIADSMHTRADIFTSLSVIVTLVAVKIGYPILDPVVTLLIAGFIGFAAFEIVREESKILVDAAAISDIRKIESLVLGVKGVRSCHKIRSRGRPDDIHIDLHIQASPDMHLDKAHQVSFAVEDAIKKALPQVTDVLVHIEPYLEKAEPASKSASPKSCGRFR